jgi:hypothetical protein
MHKGVRLVLKREDAPKTFSRLKKLKVQELEIWPSIRPDESPAEWRPFVPELGIEVAKSLLSYQSLAFASKRAKLAKKVSEKLSNVDAKPKTGNRTRNLSTALRAI